MTEIVFWACVALAAWPYLGYPVLLALLGLVRPRPVRRAACQPSVTVIIPAYNEAECIAATIENKLAQRYSADKLQIIVVSDGSTDGTDEIVRQFAAQGVQLLRREPRAGKALALNAAVRHAAGEIVVFSDGNSLFEADAIARLVENFADSDVGYVTGSLRFAARAGTVSGGGSSAFIAYEDLLRRVETRIGSIIGVNGGIDAIRRELYADVPAELITDFVLPLTVLASGRRVVFDARARSMEQANSELSSEFRMRVRVALRALQGLGHMRKLLDPVRYPGAAFCLVSHKLLRYFGFLFLAGALAANVALAGAAPVYQGLLAVQLAAYALAALGMAGGGVPGLRKLSVVPAYVVMSYAAFAVATLKYLRGETMATWRPRAG